VLLEGLGVAVPEAIYLEVTLTRQVLAEAAEAGTRAVVLVEETLEVAEVVDRMPLWVKFCNNLGSVRVTGTFQLVTWRL
jgi:hypothetical protein